MHIPYLTKQECPFFWLIPLEGFHYTLLDLTPGSEVVLSTQLVFMFPQIPDALRGLVSVSPCPLSPPGTSLFCLQLVPRPLCSWPSSTWTCDTNLTSLGLVLRDFKLVLRERLFRQLKHTCSSAGRAEGTAGSPPLPLLIFSFRLKEESHTISHGNPWAVCSSGWPPALTLYNSAWISLESQDR